MTKRSIEYAWILLHRAHLPFVAKRFRGAREARKISRTELALICDYQDLDWGLWQIENIESANQSVVLRDARRLAEPLGIDIDELWDELQNREAERRRREHEWHRPVLGDFIKAARIARGLTIREVESRASLPKHFPVSDVEEGVARFPTDRVLQALARVLEFEVEAAYDARDEEFAFYDGLGRYFTRRDCSPTIIIRGVPGTQRVDYPDGLDTAGVVSFAESIIGDDFWVPEWRAPFPGGLSPNRVLMFFPDGRGIGFFGKRRERVEFDACFEMRDRHDWKGEFYEG